MATSPKAPWWQATKTPKQGFVIGGVWAVYAVGWWVMLVIGMDEWSPWRISLALITTVLAVVYLVSAVLLRRRRRTLGEPDSGADTRSKRVSD